MFCPLLRLGWEAVGAKMAKSSPRSIRQAAYSESRRVAALCESGARLLEEQERLVRQIAQQLWNTQTLTAFRLEGRADRLRETREALRTFIREDFLGGVDADKAEEFMN